MSVLLAASTAVAAPSSARDIELHGQRGARTVARFEPSPCEWPRIGRQLGRRIDRFSALSLEMAYRLKPWIPEGTPADRIGVFAGNMAGGWSYAEGQLQRLVGEGPQRVSPYLSTAWFPAAAQGEITIRFGWMGTSRTVSGGWLAGLEAMVLAEQALHTAELDVVLVIGVESPCSPFGLLAFDDVPGVPLAEGVAAVLLARDGAPEAPRLVTEQRGRTPAAGASPYVTRGPVQERPCHVPSADPLIDVIAALARMDPGSEAMLEHTSREGRRFVTRIAVSRDVLRAQEAGLCTDYHLVTIT